MSRMTKASDESLWLIVVLTYHSHIPRSVCPTASWPSSQYPSASQRTSASTALTPCAATTSLTHHPALQRCAMMYTGWGQVACVSDANTMRAIASAKHCINNLLITEPPHLV